MPPQLLADERIYYRDRLRHARYAALADSEGFHLVCYVLEELGIRLVGKQGDLGQYEPELKSLADEDSASAPIAAPTLFSAFPALFDIVRRARNDAMHTGAYARHVTGKAIELCLLLEDALMNGNGHIHLHLVRDHMVKEPVWVEPWHPVARARQLMLTHSFSNLPILIGDTWYLLTELSLSRYLLDHPRREALGAPIGEAQPNLGLVQAPIALPDADIRSLLQGPSTRTPTSLWLVLDPANKLLGVISAFELM